MTPSVIFVPAPSGPSPIFTAQGTTDNGSGTAGSRDNDPISAPLEPDLSSITIRGTDNNRPRMFLTFANATARNAFVAAYPNGSSADLLVAGTTYTNGSLTWNNFSTVSLLAAPQFNAWPKDVPAGTSYTFRIF